MKVYYFSMHIPRDRLMAYYAGQAQRIHVMTDNHKRLELPASVFRPYVTHEGLSGRFRVAVDDANRLLSLVRLG